MHELYTLFSLCFSIWLLGSSKEEKKKERRRKTKTCACHCSDNNILKYKPWEGIGLFTAHFDGKTMPKKRYMLMKFEALS